MRSSLPRRGFPRTTQCRRPHRRDRRPGHPNGRRPARSLAPAREPGAPRDPLGLAALRGQGLRPRPDQAGVRRLRGVLRAGAPGRAQSELAAFFSGLLAEGGDIANGRAYHDSWNVVQDRYGVLPEGIDYSTLAATSKGNQLRPEFADGAFSLWLETGDELYRQRNAAHFQHMVRTSKVAFGYTILEDVTTNPVRRGDFCPGYWWSEQLKYYWLIFGNVRRFNYADHYLSTEGNLLKGAVH